MSTNDPVTKVESAELKTMSDTPEYAAPGVETVLSPEDLQREVLYAGEPSPVMA